MHTALKLCAGFTVFLVAAPTISKAQDLGIRIPLPPGVDGRPLNERIGNLDKGVVLLPRVKESTSYFGDPVDGYVILVNRTNNPLTYSLNGRKEPPLNPGVSIRWNVSGTTEHPPAFHIAFGNGRGRLIKYDLVRYSTNVFSFGPNGVDLTRSAPVKKVVAPKPVQPPTNVRIDDQGRTYLNDTYLGVARRVRFQYDGKMGWTFKIPKGWEISRRDGESLAHAHH
jgi:hypothetical protein